MSHNKQTNIATTGSRGRNPFLIAGGHGLSMQLFTAALAAQSGRYPGYGAMHPCLFPRSNEILYLLTSGRMSDADNLKLPQT